jgi:serine/threonine protein kinase
MSHALDSDTQLGEYVMEKTLGTGGFGVTYLARDSRLGTQVAIKEFFPLSYALRDPDGIVKPKNTEQAQKIYHWGLEQFLKEAQALAQFKHNNIVRVLRFMEANGTAYMVMEYEPGQSLAAQLEAGDGTLTDAKLLQVFIPILNGLQAMHEAGLVHLDIKPDNIYLGADGRPILIDFGSASQIAAQKATGQVAITPAYAAIEHYPDKGKRGPWTDIYSIGASMYRCIAGNPPIGSMERYKSILQYQKDPLILTTELDVSGYPDYLRDCIDWSLEIYPQKRPHSALMLQQGLMGKGRPGKAKQTVAASERPAKTASSPDRQGTEQYDEEGNRLVTDPLRIAKWVAAALLVIAIGATLFAWWQRPAPAPAQEIAQQDPAPAAEVGTSPAAESSSEASPDSPDIRDRSQEIPVAQTPPDRLLQRLGGHNAKISAVVTLPGGRMASADADGKILLWQPGNALAVNTININEGEIQALAASPDGKLLASGGADGVVRLWDSITGEARGALKGQSYAVYALDFSPDGRWLATAGKDRIIMVWNLQTRKVALELAGHEKAINAVRFSPDSQVLASAGENIRLWSLPTGQAITTLYGHRGIVRSVDFSADGHWLASAGFGGVIKLWDMGSGDSLNLTGAANTVFNVRFSPDSRWLASAGSNNLVMLWSVENGNFYKDLQGHGDAVTSLAFAADGSTLVSGGRDQKLIRWGL